MAISGSREVQGWVTHAKEDHSLPAKESLGAIWSVVEGTTYCAQWYYYDGYGKYRSMIYLPNINETNIGPMTLAAKNGLSPFNRWTVLFNVTALICNVLVLCPLLDTKTNQGKAQLLFSLDWGLTVAWSNSRHTYSASESGPGWQTVTETQKFATLCHKRSNRSDSWVLPEVYANLYFPSNTLQNLQQIVGLGHPSLPSWRGRWDP